MPGNPLSDPNWASNLADTVERVVGSIRDKTTKPLLLIYRGLVFGLVAVFGAVAAVVLSIIMLVRGLQALIDLLTTHENAVWISYLGIAAVFILVGMLIMSKRFPAADETAKS